MPIDPFLYVALGLGVLTGRIIRWRGPALTLSTNLTVAVLLFALGTSLGPTLGFETAGALLLGAGLAGLLLVLSALIARVIPHQPFPTSEGPQLSSPPVLAISLLFVAAVVVGAVVGRYAVLPSVSILTGALYVLLFLVGFGLVLSRKGLSLVWVPVVAALIAAVVSAAVLTLGTGIAFQVTLAAAFGFGFYSLAGPLVTAAAGPTLGLFAFFSNFLRENLTMLSAPSIGPRVKAEGLTAMGGATSMDTTLYFITRYGDAAAGPLALASGLILTLVASVALPLLL